MSHSDTYIFMVRGRPKKILYGDYLRFHKNMKTLSMDRDLWRSLEEVFALQWDVIGAEFVKESDKRVAEY